MLTGSWKNYCVVRIAYGKHSLSRNGLRPADHGIFTAHETSAQKWQFNMRYRQMEELSVSATRGRYRTEMMLPVGLRFCRQKTIRKYFRITESNVAFYNIRRNDIFRVLTIWYLWFLTCPFWSSFLLSLKLVSFFHIKSGKCVWSLHAWVKFTRSTAMLNWRS